jgi:diguanylate cyclase (GGDEF)-like protein
LATHAAIALHAAQLLEWLRQEVADKNHLALHDTLTDLANRALFNEQVEALLAQRAKGSIVAVMIMDLDRFKEVNDTLGHQSGDAVLRQIAGQLTRAVGDKGSVGRLGGDEFAVAAVLHCRADLAAVARDVLAAGHAAISVDGRHLDVAASLGIAVAPDHGQERPALLGAADAAMYHAKANGGGAAFYQPAHDHRAGQPLASFAVSAAQTHEIEDRRSANLHAGLVSREVIGQAQGILMEREHVTARQASGILQSASQYLNVKIRDVAQNLVATGEIPDTGRLGPGDHDPHVSGDRDPLP